MARHCDPLWLAVVNPRRVEEIAVTMIDQFVPTLFKSGGCCVVRAKAKPKTGHKDQKTSPNDADPKDPKTVPKDPKTGPNDADSEEVQEFEVLVHSKCGKLINTTRLRRFAQLNR